jgi:hypothetical protein
VLGLIITIRIVRQRSRMVAGDDSDVDTEEPRP